jgi:hypothetical protein
MCHPLKFRFLSGIASFLGAPIAEARRANPQAHPWGFKTGLSDSPSRLGIPEPDGGNKRQRRAEYHRPISR